MASRKVTVFDYGLGNLFSVRRAFEHCGAEVEMIDRPVSVERIDRLVVPGVGAFGDCVNGLRRHGLFDAVLRFAETGRPFLGICVGMQMLFDASEEFGSNDGLGLIPGRVVRIPETGADGRPHRLPHIGWSPLRAASEANWSRGPLAGIEPGRSVYFVHSFMGEPASTDHLAATYDYNGRSVTAAVQRDNLCGVQFHPERSGPTGLSIIGRFLGL